MKDSFIFHLENAEDLEELTLEEKGQILEAMILFTQTGQEMEFKDRAMRIAFKPILRRLRADAEAYKVRCEANKENGKKGGRPKLQIVSESDSEQIPKKPIGFSGNTEKANGFSEYRAIAKKPDSDTDTDSDTDIYINNILSGKRKEIVEYLNQKTGKHFSPTSAANVRFIEARLKEGRTVEDFKTVIDNKVADWKDTEQDQYLRPETLFTASHFESYLNQRKVKSRPKQTISVDMTHNYNMDELRRRAKE